MAMIETTNLTKRYGDVTAVEEIDLTVEQGELHGFVGHNGAGKSTTMRMLVGLARPTAGEAYIDGDPAGTIDATDKIGYAPQYPEFYETMSARDYLIYMAKVADVDGSPAARANELLEQFGLAADATQAIGGYSGGMQRRLSMAQAMLGDPELFILDEPTAALDPEGRAAIIESLEELAEGGATVFVSSHVLAELEQFVDTVTILRDGQIETSGPIEAVLEEASDDTYVVDASDNDQLRALLADHEAVTRIERRDDGALTVVPADPETFTIALPTVLSEAGLGLESLQRQGGLEERFLESVEGGER
jgi:ABC-2 type transport system ATP-binding protein